jgi:hypothetical protein
VSRSSSDFPRSWNVKLDRHPKGLHLRDVNGDGLNDVILYHAGSVGLVVSRKN